jgi:hypothetical protein
MINRESVTRQGITTLVSPVTRGGGLKLTSKLVLTADQWLITSPHEQAIKLKIGCARDQSVTRPVSGEVLKRSAKAGWTLIKLHDTLSCDSSQPELLDTLNISNKSDPETQEPHLYAGRRVYALEEAPLVVSPLTIQGQPTGAFAFYWLTTGRLLPGTPLFDQEGHFRTLSAGLSRHILDISLSTSQSLTLPLEALQGALKAARSLRDKP